MNWWYDTKLGGITWCTLFVVGVVSMSILTAPFVAYFGVWWFQSVAQWIG